MKHEFSYLKFVVGGLILTFLAVALSKSKLTLTQLSEVEATPPSLQTKEKSSSPIKTKEDSISAEPSESASSGTSSNINPIDSEDLDEESSNSAAAAVSFNPLTKKPLSKKESSSVILIAQKFKAYAEPTFTPEKAMADLQKLGLQPEMAKATDPSLGSLITISTNVALPGTRYLRLQYVTDENDVPHLQHMSAEIRPSSDAHEVAIRAIRDQFNFRGAPATERADFAEWHRDGYTAWVHQLNSTEDLLGSLHNARSKEDLGTEVIAYEINPHPHEGFEHE